MWITHREWVFKFNWFINYNRLFSVVTVQALMGRVFTGALLAVKIEVFISSGLFYSIFG